MKRKNLKKTPYLLLSRIIPGLFVLIISAGTGSAQKAGEIGLHLGQTYYMGDLNWAQHFYKTRANYGVFYKQHFDSRIILKIGGMYTHLQADDLDSEFEYQNLRNYAFETGLWEAAAQIEFHFLVYEVGETKKKNYTPYVDLGLGVSYTPDAQEDFAMNIPMGVGFKLNLTNRIVLGAEWAFRKSYSDMLDNVTGEDLDIYEESRIPASSENRRKQTGFMTNDDWYSYAAVTLSYAFTINDFKCHAYY
ncbi:MAG: DUF6089 family protein [Bacteroidales bacterium]